MKTRLLLLAASLVFAAPTPGTAAETQDSVVKVLATLRYPNPLKPWAKGDPVAVVGSGVIVEGKRILTNAHLVRYATEVAVQTRPGADKVEAKVAGNLPRPAPVAEAPAQLPVLPADNRLEAQ